MLPNSHSFLHSPVQLCPYPQSLAEMLRLLQESSTLCQWAIISVLSSQRWECCIRLVSLTRFQVAAFSLSCSWNQAKGLPCPGRSTYIANQPTRATCQDSSRRSLLLHPPGHLSPGSCPVPQPCCRWTLTSSAIHVSEKDRSVSLEPRNCQVISPDLFLTSPSFPDPILPEVIQ